MIENDRDDDRGQDQKYGERHDRDNDDDSPDDKDARQKPVDKGQKDDPCHDDDPCKGYGGGNDDPPKTGCRCRGGCKCKCRTKLPEGSIRRVFEALRSEADVPPRCKGAPDDAKTAFTTALDTLETEYQGIAELVKAYRDYHCTIDCDIDKAVDQCKEMRAWCEQVDEQTRACIEKIWRECYEEEELRIECCCLAKRRREFERLNDCRTQSEAREVRAQEDFDTVKAFLATLQGSQGRFTRLTALYDAAKAHVDNKDYEAACAVYFEFQKIYHSLHELDLWKQRQARCKHGLPPAQSGCNRPIKIKEQGWKWYRGALVDALRALLKAKYRTYCFKQEWIDAKHCMDECARKLQEFRASRQANFILEAQDCGPEDDEYSAD